MIHIFFGRYLYLRNSNAEMYVNIVVNLNLFTVSVLLGPEQTIQKATTV